MLRTRATAALATTLVASLALATSASSEELEPKPLSVDPTSGPVGTAVTLSGADCVGEIGPGRISAAISIMRPGPHPGGEVDIYTHYQFFGFDIEKMPLANADGTWTVTVKIPGSIEFEKPTVPDTYLMSASCIFHDPANGIDFPYEEVPFEVTPSPELPTTTSPPTTAPVVTPPPAAVPIVEDPPTAG